jgi:membrane protein required for colicin V production
MNFFDIVIVVIISFCLIRGFMLGIVRQVSSIVGVLAGFFAGIRYYPLLTGMLTGWVENPGYRNIAAFMIIFCGVFIAIILLAWVIHYLMKISKIGWMDRIVGVFFGAFKAVLVGSIFLIALTTFLPANSTVIRESRLAPYLTVVSEKLVFIIKRESKNRFDTNIDSYLKSWKKI